MVVGIAVFELHLPECRSLKAKRKVIKGLVDRVHSRLRVSISETDFHDLHQRSEIGIAIVGRSESEMGRLLDQVRSLADACEPDAFVTRWEPQILEGA